MAIASELAALRVFWGATRLSRVHVDANESLSFRGAASEARHASDAIV